MSKEEIIAFRESIASLESQLQQAEGKAIILEAQLGGWEAACAAQILAARAYIKSLRNTGHNAVQLAFREQLELSIDSNAGETLLAQLEQLRTALEWYADESHYDVFDAPGVAISPGDWQSDRGARARAALAAMVSSDGL